MPPAAPAPGARLRPGDRVAVLSPSFAAPGFAPAVHAQAMARIESELGLVPVEFATTRLLGASPEARAADVNAAFADESIRAVFASIGGGDQITVRSLVVCPPAVARSPLARSPRARSPRLHLCPRNAAEIVQS